MLARLVSRKRRPGRGGRPGRRPQVEQLETRTLLTGTWTGLAHASPSPNGTGTMMLLSDGGVMVQGGGSMGQVNTWYKLTPDASGSYVNGTWSALAPMHAGRLYDGSNVLPSGKAFVVGGEYSSEGSFSRSGEIYDPVSNAWTSTANFPQSGFGDDPTVLLPDGRVLAGYYNGPQTYIYDPAHDTWTQTGTKLRNDQSDEESWVKLPDDSILSYDIFSSIMTGVGHAQRYLPSTGTWVDASAGAPANLSSGAVGEELGPAFLLPDGRVFQFGATGHTAYYDPATDSWSAGPDMPLAGTAQQGADDAPGCMMPNGHILIAADTPLFRGPTHIYDFDPTTSHYTEVTPSITGMSTTRASYFSRMLMLPSGQVLLTTSDNQLAVYTPDGTVDPSLKPAIDTVVDNGDGTFTLTGTQFNGVSEGAAYGDDAEMSTNYPLLQLQDGAGGVLYARTFNWSSTGVATGSATVSTQFSLPAGVGSPAGYALSVVANGIASDSVFYQPAGPSVTRSTPTGTNFGTITDVVVTFNEEIDPTTFDLSQVDSFTRTDGFGVTDLSSSLLAVTPVAGSGNRQFDISFAGQTGLGTYALTIGPYIYDTSGNPMDQNHNGIAGEVPQDEYTANWTVAGPKITASTPTGNNNLPGTVSAVTVTFNEPMDPTTFTPDKVADFSGPDGEHVINAVSPVAGSNNTRFMIQFDPLTAAGGYQMVIGPNILDMTGHQMDQNGNFIEGEVPDDQYVAAFGLTGPTVVSTSLTGSVFVGTTGGRFTFSEPMDPTTVTADQFGLVGPGGAVTVTGVTPVAGSNNTQFDISFALSAVGPYTVSVGTNVLDAYGNPLDHAFSGQFTVTAELVTNGGFETGNFNGWTLSGTTSGTLVGGNAHSGTHAANLGPVGSEGFIAQTFATNPGGTYALDYWLSNGGPMPDQFEAYINGAVVPGSQLLNVAAFPYREYHFTFTATGSTELKFGFRQDPSYFYLDDVSVTPVPAPPSAPPAGQQGLASAASGIALLAAAPKPAGAAGVSGAQALGGPGGGSQLPEAPNAPAVLPARPEGAAAFAVASHGASHRPAPRATESLDGLFTRLGEEGAL
jgi:hypothetical protein